ncbi:Phage integrase family protein [Micromonospora echinospora]|uniref:Phage integrase family protein n=2 Tax=Micromonospora echinospora TaxID=1877 RepID=A0A1C4WIG5_MICEC|nr:Phage integrase family protein [Micromonospora echinospora]
MSSAGVVFKRCGCRDASRRRLEQSCPRLAERGHGSWYFHCSATNLLGRRERVRRGGYATTRFRKLVQRTELPPVRLHDLRHGAASLAHQAGADLKTLQDLLGHSSIVITADTYTSVLPQVQRHCAGATAHLVLTAARRTRKKIKTKARKNRSTRRPKQLPPPRPLQPQP